MVSFCWDVLYYVIVCNTYSVVTTVNWFANHRYEKI